MTNCTKIKFRVEEEPVICLLGLILEDDNEFIKFKTATRQYSIRKDCVLSMESTNVPFKEDYHAN